MDPAHRFQGAIDTADPVAPPQFVALNGLDPDQLVDVIRGGTFDHCQLGGGPLTGEVARIPTGSAHVDSGQYSKSLLVRGVFPADACTMLLIEESAPGLLVNATPVRTGDILLCDAGARLNALLPASVRWISVQVEESRVGAPETALGQGVSCFRPSAEARSAATRCASELLSVARIAPNRLGWVRQRERLASRLTAALRTGFESATPVGPGSDRSLTRRRSAVRLACGYMDEHLEQIVAAPRLCEIAGVSLRTLDYAFKQVMGVAPMAYYRARRFAAARRVLLRPDSPYCTVTSVATRFGFFHLGRFSVEYRSRFHESPSVTLARHMNSSGRLRSVRLD